MILFVGSIEQGFFVEDFDEDVEYTGSSSSLADMQNDILTSKAYRYIVIDISNFIEHYTMQVQEILKIKNCTNAEIIIMAVGYNYNSVIIQKLREAGIQYFITSSILAHQKKEMQQAMDGIQTDIEITGEELEEKILDAAPAPLQNGRTIIAIVGACKRIGTTTQAIQIIKYLSLLGLKAAYVEMNGNRYVERLKELYGIEMSDEEQQQGKVTYQGVDMFYKQEKIAAILKLDYDYYIYDFGAFTDTNFNLINFLEKDISIIVGGAKPNEMDSISALISKTIINDVFYIFSFSHSSEHEDILELMEEKAERTAFAIYSPDPFLYSAESNPVYEKMISPSPTVTLPKKKTHRKIFRWLKGGKGNG